MSKLSSQQSDIDIAQLSISDIRQGMNVQYSTTLGSQQVNEFANLSGDISPLHVDKSFGKSSIHGTNIVHGMLIASHFSTLVGVFLPGRNALLTGVDIDFIRPVKVGSNVVISGTVQSVQHVQQTISLKLFAFVNNDVVAKGSARVKITDHTQ